MRVGQDKPDSIHYFHSYAVADRVNFWCLSDKVHPTQQQDKSQIALSLLPTPEDDEALRRNVLVIISRILFENMKFFEISFEGVVDWHISHEYEKEMAQKSVVVCYDYNTSSSPSPYTFTQYNDKPHYHNLT